MRVRAPLQLAPHPHEPVDTCVFVCVCERGCEELRVPVCVLWHEGTLCALHVCVRASLQPATRPEPVFCVFAHKTHHINSELRHTH
jgi:hypothetical protein